MLTRTEGGEGWERYTLAHRWHDTCSYTRHHWRR